MKAMDKRFIDQKIKQALDAAPPEEISRQLRRRMRHHYDALSTPVKSQMEVWLESWPGLAAFASFAAVFLCLLVVSYTQAPQCALAQTLGTISQSRLVSQALGEQTTMTAVGYTASQGKRDPDIKIVWNKSTGSEIYIGSPGQQPMNRIYTQSPGNGVITGLDEPYQTLAEWYASPQRLQNTLSTNWNRVKEESRQNSNRYTVPPISGQMDTTVWVDRKTDLPMMLKCKITSDPLSRTWRLYFEWKHDLNQLDRE
jgi:hypothetical protein